MSQKNFNQQYVENKVNFDQLNNIQLSDQHFNVLTYKTKMKVRIAKNILSKKF